MELHFHIQNSSSILQVSIKDFVALIIRNLTHIVQRLDLKEIFRYE